MRSGCSRKEFSSWAKICLLKIRIVLAGSSSDSQDRLWDQIEVQQPKKMAEGTLSVSCQLRDYKHASWTWKPQYGSLEPKAGKGKAYFEKYKANRQRHAGVLLPALEPGPGVPQVDVLQLERYLQQELWAYTFGEPSPHEHHQPTMGRLADTADPVQADSAAAVVTDRPPKPQDAAKADPDSKGTIIPPPVLASRALARPAPALPARYDPALAQVYVFWDVASKHPGAADPRVVAERLRRLAGCYGNVTGLYAYAVRKDWNWVPEHFLQYRQEGTGGAREGDGRHRCPVCGVGRGTLAELQAHVRAVHPNSPAARDNDALPEEAGGFQKGPIGTAAGNVQAAGSKGAGVGVAGMRNTSRRTVGKVSQYHTARGKVVVPPSGDQLSLKYCLTQEGWEARIVQNAAAAGSVAVASGLGRLLDRVRRGEVCAGPGEKAVVLLVSDDEARLQQPLLRMRGVGGAATITVRQSTKDATGRGPGLSAVTSPGSVSSFRGADLVIRWEDVSSGTFDGRPA